MKRIMIIAAFFLIQLCKADNKIIYFIPPYGFYGDKIFDMNDSFYNKDDQNRPFYLLREKLRSYGCDLVTTTLDHELKDFAGLLVCDLPSLEKLEKLRNFPKTKIVLLILEPPTIAPHYYESFYHNHFGKVLTMIDDYVDNKKYIKLFYPQASLEYLEQPLPFDLKKFCVLIAGNKISHHPLELYSERKKIIRFFESYAPNEFDLYGFWWNKEEYPSYKGSILTKGEILKQYKYCICYENMRDVNGYVTEKIFDVFKAGCVPVYWGAQNIAVFAPSNCFIDRRAFKTDEALYAFLRSLSKDSYMNYLENIQVFLKSPQAHLFSAERFVNKLSAIFLTTQLSEISGS